ncbi:SPOR domain-containing protein [Thauera aminoaromatica]|uniref:SPOR domain-containing protein n=1 Tax=Thauera aminoaromatica TaxID=164330 RepID=A0A5C7TAI4_THASP|nr:SPOR domain-containing protein [Thauera aminoaromatica]TXH92650.1 MAG: SPOR domain-containing protein [Thauera aminoaromatica]
MSEERKTAEADAVGEDDTRRQLWVRAGMAVGLIGLLLGGLAVFDYQSRPPEPDEEVALPTKPIAPAQVAPEPGRDAPPDVLRAGAEATPRPVVPAEEAPAPSLPPDARPARAERLERPAGVAEGARPPARPAQDVIAPAAPARVETVKKTDQPATPTVPQQAVAPAPKSVTATVAPAPAVAQAPAAVQAAAAPARPSPAAQAAVAAVAPAPRASAEGAYYLPLGAFPTAEQAEVLRARLSAEGVPSHLETRVLVGPFADRRDALAAQARLREKGFTPGELLPFRR